MDRTLTNVDRPGGRARGRGTSTPDSCGCGKTKNPRYAKCIDCHRLNRATSNLKAKVLRDKRNHGRQQRSGQTLLQVAMQDDSARSAASRDVARETEAVAYNTPLRPLTISDVADISSTYLAAVRDSYEMSLREYSAALPDSPVPKNKLWSHSLRNTRAKWMKPLNLPTFEGEYAVGTVTPVQYMPATLASTATIPGDDAPLVLNDVSTESDLEYDPDRDEPDFAFSDHDSILSPAPNRITTPGQIGASKVVHATPIDLAFLAPFLAPQPPAAAQSDLSLPSSAVVPPVSFIPDAPEMPGVLHARTRRNPLWAEKQYESFAAAVPDVYFSDVYDYEPDYMHRLCAQRAVDYVLAHIPGVSCVYASRAYRGCTTRFAVVDFHFATYQPDCICRLGAQPAGCQNIMRPNGKPQHCRADHNSGSKAECQNIIIVDTPEHVSEAVFQRLTLQYKRVFWLTYDYIGIRGGHNVVAGREAERKWRRVDETRISLTDTTGSTHVTEAHDWLQSRTSRIDDNFSMIWREVLTIGKLRCHEFNRVGQARAATLVNVTKDIYLDDYYGDVSPSDLNIPELRRVTGLNVAGGITTITSHGPNFALRYREKMIYVPKEGIAVVSQWASGKRRTPELFPAALTQARLFLRRAQMNEEERADSLNYIAALGLLRNLPNEENAYNLLSFSADDFAAADLRALAPFGPEPGRLIQGIYAWVRHRPYFAIIAGMSATVAASFAARFIIKAKAVKMITTWLNMRTTLTSQRLAVRSQFISQAVALVNAAVGILNALVPFTYSGLLRAPLAALLYRAASNYTGSVDTTAAASFVYRLLAPILRRGMALFAVLELSLLRFLGRAPNMQPPRNPATICNRDRELKPLARKAHVTYRVTAGEPSDPREHECETQIGPFLVGLSFDRIYPRQARKCIHNSYVSLRNRAACRRPEPHPTYWQTTGADVAHELFYVLYPVYTIEWEKWAQRYPLSKRRMLREALDAPEDTRSHGIGRSKIFTKLECVYKTLDAAFDLDVDMDDVSYDILFDPRTIQGKEDKHLAMQGPWTYSVSKACTAYNRFHLPDSPCYLTYAPGLNADRLDEWLAKANERLASYGQLVYLSMDKVRLDASQSRNAKIMMIQLDRKLGAPDEAIFAMRAGIDCRGTTSDHINLFVLGTLGSGDSGTTSLNTRTTIIATADAFRHIPCEAIVAGDDGGAVLPYVYLSYAMGRVREVDALTGYETTMQASRYSYDMEFCSGRWWPADNQYGHAFGPKPGKMLPKLFWVNTTNVATTDPGGYVFEIARALLPAVNHLPLACDVLQRLLEITQPARLNRAARKSVDRALRFKRRERAQISEDIWDAYAHIYGITQDEVSRAIDNLRYITSLPCNWDTNGLFRRMLEQDAPAVGEPPSRDCHVFNRIQDYIFSDSSQFIPACGTVRRFYPDRLRQIVHSIRVYIAPTKCQRLRNAISAYLTAPPARVGWLHRLMPAHIFWPLARAQRSRVIAIGYFAWFRQARIAFTAKVRPRVALLAAPAFFFAHVLPCLLLKYRARLWHDWYNLSVSLGFAPFCEEFLRIIIPGYTPAITLWEYFWNWHIAPDCARDALKTGTINRIVGTLLFFISQYSIHSTFARQATYLKSVRMHALYNLVVWLQPLVLLAIGPLFGTIFAHVMRFFVLRSGGTIVRPTQLESFNNNCSYLARHVALGRSPSTRIASWNILYRVVVLLKFSRRFNGLRPSAILQAASKALLLFSHRQSKKYPNLCGSSALLCLRKFLRNITPKAKQATSPWKYLPKDYPLYITTFLSTHLKIPKDTNQPMNAKPQRPPRNRGKSQTTTTTVVKTQNANRGRRGRAKGKQVVVYENRPPRPMRTEIIHDNVDTAVGHAHQKRRRGARRKTENPYLATLVDPEKFVGVRFPDEFGQETATFPGLINFDCPVFGTADSASGGELEAPGTFFVVLRPTLEHPVLTYQRDDTGIGGGPVPSITSIISSQNSRSGLYPLTPGSATASNDGSMVLNPGDNVNLKGEYGWDDQPFTVPMFEGTDTNGDSFFGFPVIWCDNSNTPSTQFIITVHTDSNYDLSNSSDGVSGLFVEAFTESGSTPSGGLQLVPVTCIAGSSNQHLPNAYTGQFSVASLCKNTTGGGFHDAFIPHPGVGFRMSYPANSVGLTGQQIGPVGIISVTIRQLILSVGHSPVAPIAARWVANEFAEYGIVAPSVDRYRMVSAMMWGKCVAPTLNDGGQLAACLYGGGASPMELDIIDYATLAQVPNAYDGEFNKGCYVIWKPSNESDMLFRFNGAEDPWEFPTIALAGVYVLPAGGSTTSVLRIRCAMNFEYITKYRITTTEPSPVNPALIRDAHRYIDRNFKIAQENPLHWSDVQRAVASAAGYVGKAAGWAYSNRSWLIPAATTAAGLFL